MDTYDKSLVDILNERGHKFSSITVFQIGIQMIQMLEKLHSVGFVHNDLRLENICVDLSQEPKN